MKHVSKPRVCVEDYRPRLEALENRWQPGSILSTELGWSALLPALASLASDGWESEAVAVIGQPVQAAAAPVQAVAEPGGPFQAPPLQQGAPVQAVPGSPADNDLTRLAGLIGEGPGEGGAGTSAQCLNYRNGFGPGPGPPPGLTANGSTTFPVMRAQLTPEAGGLAGSVFSSARTGVQTFTNNFIFQITSQADPMADGMGFVIHGDVRGATALGPTGGGLGYAADNPNVPIPPDAIMNSVIVKFDIWNNAGETENSTGLFRNGRSPTLPRAGGDTLVALDGTGIALRSRDFYLVDMSYDGAFLFVAMINLGTLASATQIYIVDIPGTVGGNMGYVGFTGATGGVTANQSVLSWEYCGTP